MESPNQFPRDSRQIEIDEANERQRIDNFLIKSLKGVPKSRIYRMIRKGEVRINRGRTRAQYHLKIGDMVRIPPIRFADSSADPKPSKSLSILLEKRVLFEDDHVLAIDKPSGLPVHGGSGLKSGLIETLRLLRPELRFLELVHRLDKDTSGCLLLAKKRACLKALHNLFLLNEIDKYYSALLSGRWSKKILLVDAPLKKFIKQNGERLVVVRPDGKSAKTLFRRVSQYKSATMVEAKLLTGRTHQVRVHAAYIEFPIAGDNRYGNKSANHFFRQIGLNRLFLHASDLRFLHPFSAEPVSIHAPLDPHLARFLGRLENEL